jgi:hypothetical protein
MHNFSVFGKESYLIVMQVSSLPSQIRPLERKHQPGTYIPMLKYFSLFDICTGSNPPNPTTKYGGSL